MANGNGNGATASAATAPAAAPVATTGGATTGNVQDMQPVPIGGVTVWFPKSYTPAQIDAAKQNDPHLRALATNPESYIRSNPPTPEAALPPSPMMPHTAAGVTPGTPTTPIAGETPKGAPTGDMAPGQVQPQTQVVRPMQPGFTKDVMMDAENALRGTLTGYETAGDINDILTRSTGGFVPFLGLPTTQSLDRDFPISPELAPVTPGERIQAMASRGGGAGLTAALMPSAWRAFAEPFLPASGVPARAILPTVGEAGRTIASGAAGGAASQAAIEAAYPPGTGQVPSGPAPVLAPAAIGLVAGGAIPRMMAAGPGMVSRGIHNLLYGDPYNNVIARTGADIAARGPTLASTGTQVRQAIDQNIANSQPLAVMLRGGAPPTPGAGGLYGTDLSQGEYDRLFGTGNMPPSAITQKLLNPNNEDIANKVLPELVNSNNAGVRDTVTGSAIGNGLWADAHPSVKANLVEDPAERAAVEANHGTGVSPAARASAMERLMSRNISVETAGTMGGLLGNVYAHFMNNDPVMSSLTGALFATTPYVRPALRRFANDPAGTIFAARHALLGGATSIAPTDYMMNPGSGWGMNPMPSGSGVPSPTPNGSSTQQ